MADRIFIGTSNSEIYEQEETAAPSILSITVADSTLNLAYNKTLNETEPAASSFTVKVAGNTRSVSTVLIDGAIVVLTLSSPVLVGQTVTLSYVVPGTNPIRDTQGNLATAFTDQAVTNNTPRPRLESLVINGNQLVLTYDENLNETANPAAGIYAAVGSGAAEKVVSSAVVSLNKVTCTTQDTAQAGQTVTVSYYSGLGLSSANRIKDIAGNQADGFFGSLATNNTVSATPGYIQVAWLAFEAPKRTETPTVQVAWLSLEAPKRADPVPVSGLPDAPTIGTATAGNGQATVSFTPPANNGGSAITNYRVTSSPGGISATGTSSPITVTGLANGTAYNFTVVAINANGESVPSSPSNTVTPATVPGAPTNVAAVAGNQQATISFNPPASNGGRNITQYTAVSSPGGISASSQSTSFNVTGLTNGVSYTFTVTATNAIGTGPASSPSNAVVPASGTSLPGPPSIVSASPGNGQVTVHFAPPSSDGGSAITSYRAISSPGGFSATSTGSPITVPGLANGTSYTFTVRATNAAGEGPASAPSNAVTPATVPGSPTIVSVSPENGQLVVSFNPPASDGGSPITSYVATATPGGRTATGSGSPLTITQLTNGTAYTVTVRAINAIGSGPESGASNPVTPTAGLSVPGPPTGVHAVAGSGEALVSFSAPASNGGSPITNYTVTSTPGGLVGAGSTSPILVTGLTNDVAYTFRVTATNAQGTSSPSIASNSVTPRALVLVPFGTRSGVVVVACDMFGDSMGELVGVTAKDPEWVLNGPGSAKLVVDPLASSASLIKINEMEIQIWIDDVLRWWGVPRAVKGDSRQLEFACEGLLSHFLYRGVTTSLLYTSIDQVTIGWNLVAFAQTGTDMERNISSAAFPLSGVPRSRDYKYEDGHIILDLLQEFPELDRGFDFDIVFFPDGRREWTPFYPSKGSLRNNLVLEWGRNITDFTYSEDGTEQGTHVYAKGGNDTNGAQVEQNYNDTVLSAKYGRMHRYISEGNQLDPIWLLDAAKEEVRANGNPIKIPDLTVKNDPVQLDGVLETGDIVPARMNHGRCQLDGLYRIVKIKRLDSSDLVLTLNTL